KLAKYEALGYGHLPVCMAKTQNSLSDDPQKLGRPRDFTVTIRDARLAAGAGFVVAYAGDILTMPGLPKKPAAESIDMDEQGNIVGLFWLNGGAGGGPQTPRAPAAARGPRGAPRESDSRWWPLGARWVRQQVVAVGGSVVRQPVVA